MKKAIQRLKNERGLTLVELLAVIVILAIVMIIAFVFIGGIIDNSKKDAHISNAQQVIAAAKLYEASGGTIPESGNTVTVAKLQSDKFLEDILDPWNKKAYGTGAIINKKEGIITLTNFNASGCNMGTDPVSETDIIDEGRELCN